jgi:hypothetical protein
MSHVTAVVLMLSGMEEDSEHVHSPGLAALQSWLRAHDVGQLVSIDQMFGGWKHPGITCWGGGFNHLDVEDFTAVFRQQEWRRPEQAVLVLTTEDEPSVVVRARG